MGEEQKTDKLMEQYKKKVEEEQRKAEAQMQVDMVISKLLTPKARERLSNVRLVNKALYLQVASQLIKIANKGTIVNKIDDETVRAILSRLKSPKKEFNIRRR